MIIKKSAKKGVAKSKIQGMYWTRALVAVKFPMFLNDVARRLLSINCFHIPSAATPLEELLIASNTYIL